MSLRDIMMSINKAGASYGSLRKFEQTGQISLESLLKLAVILRRMDDFKSLFDPSLNTSALSLDVLIGSHKRKGGRK